MRRVFTPDNARRTLYVLITAFFSTFLYVTAIVLYALIYYHFIPESSVSVPLYFDYSWLAADPYHVLPSVTQHSLASAVAAQQNAAGIEHSDLAELQHPGPFAAVDLSASLLPLMRSTIAYKLSVDLNLPRNAHNQNLGNFMVRLAVTPNIHEFVRLHGPAATAPGVQRGIGGGGSGGGPPVQTYTSRKQEFFRNAGLVSRFPLTHFPESYIMDLPKYYIRGPATAKTSSAGCKCEANNNSNTTKCACGGSCGCGGSSEGGTNLYSGVPLHRVTPGPASTKKHVVSVLSTRPAILSYKPLLLEYLEVIFWSPVYALGLIRSGFNEQLNLDMVENWTKKAALTGNLEPSQPFPFPRGVMDSVAQWAASSSAYLKDAGTSLFKFRVTEDLDKVVVPRGDELPPKKSIKAAFEGLEEQQDFLESEPDAADGHVWAVVELDRVAHLNGATLTLHTQWQGLRFWMHKYRLVLFLIAPMFIWFIECIGAVLAGYLVVTLFGGSSDSASRPNSAGFTSAGGGTAPAASTSATLSESSARLRAQQRSLRQQSTRSGVGSATRPRRRSRPSVSSPSPPAPITQVTLPRLPARTTTAASDGSAILDDAAAAPVLSVVTQPDEQSLPAAEQPVTTTASESTTPTTATAPVSSSSSSLSNYPLVAPPPEHPPATSSSSTASIATPAPAAPAVAAEHSGTETPVTSPLRSLARADDVDVFGVLPNRSVAPPPSVTPATAHGTTASPGAAESPVSSLRVSHRQSLAGAAAALVFDAADESVGDVSTSTADTAVGSGSGSGGGSRIASSVVSETNSNDGEEDEDPTTAALVASQSSSPFGK